MALITDVFLKLDAAKDTLPKSTQEHFRHIFQSL